MKRKHEHDYQAKRPNPTVLVCSCGRFKHVNPEPIIEIVERKYSDNHPDSPKCHRDSDICIY